MSISNTWCCWKYLLFFGRKPFVWGHFWWINDTTSIIQPVRSNHVDKYCTKIQLQKIHLFWAISCQSSPLSALCLHANPLSICCYLRTLFCLYQFHSPIVLFLFSGKFSGVKCYIPLSLTGRITFLSIQISIPGGGTGPRFTRRLNHFSPFRAVSDQLYMHSESKKRGVFTNPRSQITKWKGVVDNQFDSFCSVKWFFG